MLRDVPHQILWLLRSAQANQPSDPRDPLLQSERTQGFAADPDYWKGAVFAYVGLPQNLKDLKGASAAGGCAASRSRTAGPGAIAGCVTWPSWPKASQPHQRRAWRFVIRKDAGLYCGPRLRKGEVFAYVGRNQNLKDLKAGIPSPTPTEPPTISSTRASALES